MVKIWLLPPPVIVKIYLLPPQELMPSAARSLE